ncbi:hypothetical protein N9C48_00875 [bacterium]|jgi:hypothetical protein|nr:hypothetical protein [bacterium]
MKKDLKALGLIAGKKKMKQMAKAGYIASALLAFAIIYSIMM